MEGDPGFIEEEMHEEKDGLDDGNGVDDSSIQARTPCRRMVAWRMVIGCLAGLDWYVGRRCGAGKIAIEEWPASEGGPYEGKRNPVTQAEACAPLPYSMR